MYTGLHVKLVLSDFKDSWYSSTDLQKYSNIKFFMETRLMVTYLFHTDGQTDAGRQTDTTNLADTFCNPANAPDKALDNCSTQGTPFIIDSQKNWGTMQVALTNRHARFKQYANKYRMSFTVSLSTAAATVCAAGCRLPRAKQWYTYKERAVFYTCTCTHQHPVDSVYMEPWL
jgi:hypothetical protein